MKTIAEGKFTKYCEVDSWEFISRKNTKGVVTIVPIDFYKNTIILIKQFRKPIGKYVIEFPAGLVDKGESVLKAAKRELLEETGYKILHVISQSSLLSKSAGITNETTTVVTTDVQGGYKQNLQDNEEIEVIEVSLNKFFDFYKNIAKKKDIIIDSFVYSFFLYREGIK